MFIQSYEKLRSYIYSSKTIETLIQFEYSAFEEATVPICTFVLKNSHVNKNGCYFRLTDFRGGMEVQRQKTLEAIADHKCGYYYESNSENFSKILGMPVAYWVSENFVRAFENKIFKDYMKASVGIQTGDNETFIRDWWEICVKQINFEAQNISDTFSDYKYYLYNKGGNYRKWYGNLQYVVEWKNNGKKIKKESAITGHHCQDYSDDLKFKPFISWSRLTSGKASFRKCTLGYLSDMAGFCLFPENQLTFVNRIGIALKQVGILRGTR